MTDTFQPGPHLSPDQLSAFAENVLPEHERLAALTHLAGCGVCRDAVFLTQQADPALIAPTPVAETSRRSWFSFGQLFGAATAALACTLILALIIHHRHQDALTTTSVTTAKVEPQPALTPPQLQPAPATAPATAPAKISAATPQPVVPVPAPKPAHVQMAPPPRTMAMGTGMPSAHYDESRPKDIQSTAAPSATPASSAYAANSAASANTYVPLAPKAPAVMAGAMPAPAAPPPAPEPRMHQSAAPNAAKSEAGKGAGTNQTVAVAAAAPAVNTSDATIDVASDSLSTTSMQESALTGRAKRQAAKAIQLPSNVPAANVIRSAGRTLALDTAGNVFLSVDSGKRWTAVTPQWLGKAVTISVATSAARLYLQQPAQNQSQNQSNNADNYSVNGTATPPQQSPIAAAGFELTTSAGSVWRSTDGITWQPR